MLGRARTAIRRVNGRYGVGAGSSAGVCLARNSAKSRSWSSLGVLDSGQTITMHVGDVLALPGLFAGEDPSTAQPTRSTDPAVLGPLGTPEQRPFATRTQLCRPRLFLGTSAAAKRSTGARRPGSCTLWIASRVRATVGSGVQQCADHPLRDWFSLPARR